MFPGLEFGGYVTLTCSAWTHINLFFLTQMFIVQVYVFIWYNIICFEIIISVHRSTRWSLFGIRINERVLCTFCWLFWKWRLWRRNVGNNPQPQTLAVSHVLDVRLMYLYFCFESEPSDNFQNTAVEMHVSDEKC